MLTHPFAPLYDANSHTLILGSFPSVKSREVSFYYGHPQNRFWKVMSSLLHEPLPVSTEEKRSMLLKHGIALFDVIGSCNITGSSDSSIHDVTVNDLTPIIKASHIGSCIFTNGNKATELYMKYTYPVTLCPCTLLPSTSPANAAFSLERLTEIWAERLGL